MEKFVLSEQMEMIITALPFFFDVAARAGSSLTDEFCGGGSHNCWDLSTALQCSFVCDLEESDCTLMLRLCQSVCE